MPVQSKTSSRTSLGRVEMGDGGGRSPWMIGPAGGMDRLVNDEMSSSKEDGAMLEGPSNE